MTAPFVTPLRRTIALNSMEAVAAHALATLKRGIRGGTGTLWERVEESGKNLVVIGGWLAEYTGEHTCGTGNDGYYGAHEPGCGLEPIYHFGVTP